MRGLLFLLSALFLLESTKGTEYDKLDDHDRRIVDKAIKQANKDQGKGKHLDYYTIVKTHNNMLNVILRPTSCDSTPPSVHRKECKTENKRPQVSCIDCNGAMKPCLLLKQTKEIKKRINRCQRRLLESRLQTFFWRLEFVLVLDSLVFGFGLVSGLDSLVFGFGLVSGLVIAVLEIMA